jgi:hypothetical protein
MRRNKIIYGPLKLEAYFGMSFDFESGTAGVGAGAAGTLVAGTASMTLPDFAGREPET